MSDAARLLIDAASVGWRHLSATKPRRTPPRYAMRMYMAGKGSDYLRKPNIMPKSRRNQHVV